MKYRETNNLLKVLKCCKSSENIINNIQIYFISIQ